MNMGKITKLSKTILFSFFIITCTNTIHLVSMIDEKKPGVPSDQLDRYKSLSPEKKFIKLCKAYWKNETNKIEQLEALGARLDIDKLPAYCAHLAEELNKQIPIIIHADMNEATTAIKELIVDENDYDMYYTFMKCIPQFNTKYPITCVQELRGLNIVYSLQMRDCDFQKSYSLAELIRECTDVINNLKNNWHSVSLGHTFSGDNYIFDKAKDPLDGTFPLVFPVLSKFRLLDCCAGQQEICRLWIKKDQLEKVRSMLHFKLHPHKEKND
jgi:hypothetical protein